MIPWLILAASTLAVFGIPVDHRTQVPEDFLIKLQTAQNISQFLNSWVDQAAVQRAYLLQGEEDEASVEVAHPAGCIPEMQIVEFERPYDPSLVIWPICTRVKRCSGCCISKLLHCVPTRTSILTVKVIKARYPHPGAEMLELEGYENVRLEVHERCACKCRQQQRDCTPSQRYQAGQCRCVCINQHEAAHCRQPDHYWESKECACKCRHIPDCSTGSVFNNHSCKCEPMNQSSPEEERVPAPVPVLNTFLHTEGGENNYRLHYPGLDPSIHVGPFAMAQYKQEDRTILVDNVTQSQWTEQ